jgi:2-aminoadipate transaminase
MFHTIQLDPRADAPLYRQLFEAIKQMIGSGTLAQGERLPATRELAGRLGLNRATVSAAYALLESEALVEGHVGRGSFVIGGTGPSRSGLDWEQLLPPSEPAAPTVPPPRTISFASSCPAEDLFPLEDFRASCEEVLASGGARAILQLGSPAGYAPLRHYLLDEARGAGVVRPSDDLIVVNGCQQALDLLARVLVRPADTVVVEDPVYPGLKNVFLKAGAQLVGVPTAQDGVDIDALERAALRVRPRLIVLTPDFQNPTGGTLALEARRSVARIARAAGAVLVENDVYGDLRYAGEPVPSIKRIDETGDTVLLRSFSKLTFPGLRVGWMAGPRALVARVAEAKHLADLHTDQLSQAALLRFAESGRLAAHRQRVLAAGGERLRATLEACAASLPAGTQFTRPQGGMSLWVRLPEPLDASDLLARARREGVNYLPGRFFEVSRREPGALRLSFAGLEPAKIRAGLAALGQIFASELARARIERPEPAPAMV